MKKGIQDKICCKEFNPESWDGREHVWNEKLFVKDYVRQIFHIPLNMGAVLTRMTEKIESEDAKVKDEDFLILAYDPSPWKSEIYINVSKEIRNMENVKLSGRYISKVYDGPYKDVPKWMDDFKKYLENQQHKMVKFYLYYTTCPKCAKKYGHNYVVAFAQIEN